MSLTITEATRLATIATAVVQREHEIFHYQINIDNYTAMLAARWTPEEQEYHDRIAALLLTEKAEQSKAKRVYDALIAQLPADQMDALITTAAAAMP
jgi:hypothetical protein